MGIGSLGHWACSCKKTRAPLYHRANQPCSAENNSPQPAQPSTHGPVVAQSAAATGQVADEKVGTVVPGQCACIRRDRTERYCLSDLDSVIAHLPFVDAARYLFCTWVSALYHRPAPVVLWPPVRLIDETCLAHSSPIPDSGLIPAFWITNTHSCLSRATTAGERNLNLIRYLTLRSPPIRYDTTTTKSSRMGENGGGEHGVVVAARTTPVSRSSSV